MTGPRRQLFEHPPDELLGIAGMARVVNAGASKPFKPVVDGLAAPLEEPIREQQDRPSWSERDDAGLVAGRRENPDGWTDRNRSKRAIVSIENERGG